MTVVAPRPAGTSQGAGEISGLDGGVDGSGAPLGGVEPLGSADAPAVGLDLGVPDGFGVGVGLGLGAGLQPPTPLPLTAVPDGAGTA